MEKEISILPTFSQNLVNFGPQNGCVFWPTVTVIASVFTRRSPNASQPNFATCSEMC